MNNDKTFLQMLGRLKSGLELIKNQNTNKDITVDIEVLLETVSEMINQCIQIQLEVTKAGKQEFMDKLQK